MTTVQIAVGNFNTKTRLFKYIENFTSKKLKIFRKKKKTLIIFIFLLKNIDCGYSLEPPRRGGSNEYPQSMFLAEIRKIIYTPVRGWSGVAMVSCILRHRGVQLKLAYSWARPAILVAGKGRGGMFLFLLFLHFHSCSYFFPNRLFHHLYYLFYLFSPFLWETTQNDPQGLTCR